MEIVPVDALSVACEVMEQLPRGAFLTVKCRHHVNTMTIGWGTIGVVWSRPVFVVGVRTSRYTFKLIEQAPDFTVTVPVTGSCKQELAFCGSRSGKVVNKFDACNLKVRPSEGVDTPTISIEGMHFECRTLLRTPMTPDLMAVELSDFYGAKDYHTFYYGEILGCSRQTA